MIKLVDRYTADDYRVDHVRIYFYAMRTKINRGGYKQIGDTIYLYIFYLLF
jgi:hypothetical protein